MVGASEDSLDLMSFLGAASVRFPRRRERALIVTAWQPQQLFQRAIDNHRVAQLSCAVLAAHRQAVGRLAAALEIFLAYPAFVPVADGVLPLAR